MGRIGNNIIHKYRPITIPLSDHHHRQLTQILGTVFICIYKHILLKVNIYLCLSAGFGFGVVGGVGAPASIVV